MKDDINPRVEEQIRRAAAKSTELITRRAGERVGIWYACGYPKSGTVWLAELMAAYLHLPYPQNYLLPVLMPSVVHSHWRYAESRSKCVYIVRDGRDVMVSYYFHFLSEMRSGRSPGWTADRKKKLLAMRPGVELDDVQAILPAFIELEFESPRGIRINWADHVRQWLGGVSNGNVAVVRYEDLLVDGPQKLGDAIEHLDPRRDRSDDRLKQVFEFLSFRNVTGREPGSEDRSAFRRKATPGDWRTHFSEEAVATFDRRCGAILAELGYS